MAISVRAAGTWSVATTQSPAVAIPAGYQAGDLGILVSAWRPYTVSATIDQSWTEIVDESPGTTANGIGAGSSRLFVAYKVLGASETNPTLTRSGAITPGGQVIIVLQKGAADGEWTVEKLANAVEQAMASTAMSHNLTTTAAIKASDLVFALTGVADDTATFTRATTAISGGPSWSGNVVEYPATHASSTTGNDMAADLIYRVASSGVASGQTITVTATLAAAERVASVLFRVYAAQGVSLDLLDAANALYAPSVSGGGGAAQDIVLGLLDAGAALFAPTLTPKNTITLPLLEAVVGSSTPTVRNTSSYVSSATEASIVVPVPSGVQDGDVMFCHVHVTASSGNIVRNTAWTAIYENQFSGSSTSSRSSLFYRVASSEPADYTWTIPSGRASASVVAMYGVDTTTPVEASQVAVDATAGTTVTAPTVTSANGTKLLTWHGGRTATVSVETTYTPDGAMDSELVDVSSVVSGSSNSSHEVAIDTVTAGQATGTRAATASQTVNWIAYSVIPKPASGGGEQLFAPTLTPKNTITLVLLDGAPELFAPTVAQPGGAAQEITLGLLDGANALYAPTVSPAPTTITLGLLDAGPALYAPSFTLGPVTISLGLLDAGSALYAPTIATISTITLGLIDAGAALFAPTLTPKNTISLGLLDAGSALYAPSIAAGPVTIVLGLLDAGAALYAPTVVALGGTQAIVLGLLDAGADLFAPTVAPAPVSIALVLLDAGPALYAPTLTWGNTIVLPLLDGGAELYPPSVATTGSLIYGHTRDVNGRAIPFATVDVFVSATNALYATTTSDATGLYQVVVQPAVEYFIVAYTAVEFGTTARDLVGV